MKVTIEHGEVTEGLFKKTTYNTVTVHVIFSEEEKHVISENDLRTHVLLKRPVPANMDARKFAGIEDVHWLKVHHLVKGPDTYVAGSTGDAKAYENDLKEVLPMLKQLIEGNKPVENKSTSFEL